MRLHKTIVSVLVCMVLLGSAGLANAGPPPQGDDPSPGKGGFDPLPIQPGRLVVDRSTGDVIFAELSDPARAQGTAAVEKLDDTARASFRPAGAEDSTFAKSPASRLQAQDVLIGSSPPVGGPGEDLGVAASTLITLESFEATFPPANWQIVGTHDWGKVNCFPVEGTSSIWPAVDVADPCNAEDYPADVQAWLEFGPFNLADAQSASLDFFFRLDSQSCEPLTDCDFLFWGASTDGNQYFGDFAAGTHVGGPFPNGYNFASLDLGFVAGEPQVWISFVFVSNGDSIAGKGPFIDLVALRKNSDPRETITFQTFDVDEFPNSSWIPIDNDGSANGEYLWDDVACFSRSGGWSMWPADEGVNGLDPCFAGNDYANNMDSWLVHGPLDLTPASEAWVDFFFRNESEDGPDELSWLASTDGSVFHGYGVSGQLANGPHDNGYNLMRFNLSTVPVLGDLRGQPEVWLAFRFKSNGATTGRGPFLDDVSVMIEVKESPPTPRTFLPILLKTPPSITRLFITNKTGGTLSYAVKNTPEGTKSCSVADNQVKLCATFSPGTYNWEATARCGKVSGTRDYPPGDDYPKAFECK